MAELIKPWSDGGNLSVTYDGDRDGSAIFKSDPYEGIDREMSVTFKSGDIKEERIVRQEGIRQPIGLSEGGIFRVANGGRFGVLKDLKPYTEVEYIESTGTQWIHTGIFPNDNTVKCEVKIAYSSTSTGQLMGSGVSGNTRFNFGIESGRFRFGFGGGWFDANSAVLTVDTEPHVFVLDANTKTGSIDGVPQATTNTYTPTGKNVLMLFARGVSSSAESSNRTRGKMYYAKIWDKGVLVRDLIPVLDKNNVACMYDKVSKEFFYNQGSGSFLYGNILGEYTPIEYIESTGTQWINTGVNIDTSTDEVELVIQGLTTTLYKWFFGEHDDGARFGLGSGDGPNKRNVAYGKTTYKVNDTQIYNSKHTFVANKNGVFLDGVKITNYASFTSSSTIYLFNLNISSQSSYTSSARIWSYKQTRNGQELINLIPVLDNNDVACMYDKVSKEFFYNKGTGEFIAGNIK